MPAKELQRWMPISQTGRIGLWISRHHTRTCVADRHGLLPARPKMDKEPPVAQNVADGASEDQEKDGDVLPPKGVPFSAGVTGCGGTPRLLLLRK